MEFVLRQTRESFEKPRLLKKLPAKSLVVPENHPLLQMYRAVDLGAGEAELARSNDRGGDVATPGRAPPVAEAGAVRLPPRPEGAGVTGEAGKRWGKQTLRVRGDLEPTIAEQMNRQRRRHPRSWGLAKVTRQGLLNGIPVHVNRAVTLLDRAAGERPEEVTT